jgi:hypothetical protein
MPKDVRYKAQKPSDSKRDVPSSQQVKIEFNKLCYCGLNRKLPGGIWFPSYRSTSSHEAQIKCNSSPQKKKSYKCQIYISLVSINSGKSIFGYGEYVKMYEDKQAFFFGFLVLEGGTDRLSQNVGKELPLNAAQHLRRTQISSTPRRKPETTHDTILYDIWCILLFNYFRA